MLLVGVKVIHTKNNNYNDNCNDNYNNNETYSDNYIGVQML